MGRVLTLVEFSYNNSYQSTIQMAPFEALHGRQCRTRLRWGELDEALITGSEMIQETTEKIRRIQEHIKSSSKPPKELRQLEKKTIGEFQVGDKVFLKVSPIKGLRRFNVRGKLSPRYIRPYEIIEKLNLVAYRLCKYRDIQPVCFSVNLIISY